MTDSALQELLDRICDRILEVMDTDAVLTARRRQADVMAGREPDYLPMSFGRGGALGPGDWPSFDWAEQWNDPAKSLYCQLNGTLNGLAGRSDTTPSVRADTGVINCTTVFGAKHVIPTHTKPVICEYVPKEVLQDFEVPDDISGLGVLPHMVRHMEHHVEALRTRGLADWVRVRHCDQQGPFDIAAQARGHDIFVDLYDDGDFVHELMAKCTDVYIKTSILCKELADEPLDGGDVYGVWMTNGGVRMCGDSDILVGLDQYLEFIRPYQEEAFQPFGGGWMHYCGGAKDTGRSEGLHLHDGYTEVEGLRGLNWTTGLDWLAEMRKLREKNVVHIGGTPREDAESLAEYFQRVLSAYDRRWGLVFQGPALRSGEHDGAMDAWHTAQDKRWPN